MAIRYEKIFNFYKFIIHDLADDRTKGFLLIDNPFHVMFVIFLYIYLVKKLGPAMMKNCEPFKLQRIMIVYNIAQILANAIIFIEGFINAYGPTGKYSFYCQPVDFNHDEFSLKGVRLFHFYYVIKLADLLDTIFMVLRKKNNHITFLHVYHHAGMVALSWGCVKYYPSGHGAFVGFANSFVHVVMYTYYLLTLVWPAKQRKLLWWKKYLTLLQITQFIIIGVHMTLPLFHPNCNYPLVSSFIVLPQALFMIMLFGDFYWNAYVKAKSEQVTSEYQKNKLS